MKQYGRDTLLPIGQLKHFLHYLRQYRLKLVLVATFSTITTIIPLAFPHLLRIIIDDAYPVRDLGLFWRISALMVGLTLILNAMRSCSSYLSTRINYDLRCRIQKNIFKTMNDLPMSYLERTGPNVLIERMSHDSRQISQTLLSISLPVLFIVTFVLMSRISIRFSLIVLAIIPLYYAVTVVTTGILRKLQHQYRGQIEKVKNVIDESFHGTEVLKLFGHQKKLQQTVFEKAQTDTVALEMKTWRYTFIYGRLSELLTSGWAFVLTIGGFFLMFKGYLQMGEALALGMYVAVLMRPFSRVINLYKTLVSASVAAQRIIELDAYQVQALSLSRRTITRTDLSQGINMQNVSFSYLPEKPVLRDLSLDVPAGSTLAIIGPNGSGKTTLLKLIANYYTHYTGKILFGNTELRNMSAKDYSEHIAMVWAENQFFGRTILENCQTQDESNGDEIRQIANTLGFDAWIKKLYSGYHSILGIDGTKLSSGESHKIALLRALAKRPSILLIDEFSSCLDIESEQALLQGLGDLRRDDGITIIVTHKIDVALQPWIHQVAVLSEGRLVQCGSPEQLIDAKIYCTDGINGDLDTTLT